MKRLICSFKALACSAGILTWSCLPACSAEESTPKLEVQTTFGKKVLENARYMTVTPLGVKILHDAGVSVIPVSSLPKEWVDKFAPNASAMQTAPAQAAKPTEAPRGGAATTTSGTAPQTATSSSFDPGLLVIIKTDSGSGSGFIAKANDKIYVYTNAHVLCGTPGGFTSKIVSVKTASGRLIPTPTDVELSEIKDATSESGLEDVARFPIALQEGESAYEIGELDSNTAMTSKVTAYGNSLGGDVVTSLPGQILGLGTDRVEVSCEIVPGNSGGPVVLDQTKKVIGISSYLTNGQRDIWAKDTQFSQVRRFALRPEKVTKWRRMKYTSLMSSTSELNGFDRDTLSLAAACFLNPKANNAGFDLSVQNKGDYAVRTVLSEGSRYSLGQTINNAMARANQKLGGGMGGPTARLAVQAVVGTFAEFFATVTAASSSQILSMQNADRAPYLKKLIPELIQERQKVHSAFVQQAARFR